MKYPNINAEMARNGMTRDDLAKKMGVTRKTVYNWLTLGKIPMHVMVKLAELLNCSVDYLLGRTD